jgi:hypothetical protein
VRPRPRRGADVGGDDAHAAAPELGDVGGEERLVALELRRVTEDRQPLDGERRALGRPSQDEGDLPVAEDPQRPRGAGGHGRVDGGVERAEVQLARRRHHGVRLTGGRGHTASVDARAASANRTGG